MSDEQTQAEELGAKITELCSQIYAAEHRLLTLIREFDEHEYWSQLGLASCAHWLNLKCGIGMNAAREKVRVAHALKSLPKISEHYSKGELSYSKVRAITRIADENNEDTLLMIAEHGTAHHVEKLVSKCRRAKRLQEGEDADAPHRNRELTHYYDHDGCLVIKARLPAEQGALVVKALEMAMDQDFRRDDDVTAVTSGEPKNQVTAVTPEQKQAPEQAHELLAEPIAARRADALAAVAETYMNNSESSGATADRYQVVVHVSAQTQQQEAGPEVTAVTSHLDDGPHVTAETSRRIACDCSLVNMALGMGTGMGQSMGQGMGTEIGKGFGMNTGKDMAPISIGRRSRSIPPPMRRALQARDGGCRFPGCTHTRFVDGHHIEHWADGGETSLDNLILLCRHHHHLVHEGGFDCVKTASCEVIFKDKLDERLPGYWALPGVATEDYERWLDNEFFEPGIRRDACAAKWRGEQMDYQMAVGALLG